MYVEERITHTTLLTITQINPYMSNPCHIELILTEATEAVQKAEPVAQRLNSRQQGRATRRAITAA